MVVSELQNKSTAKRQAPWQASSQWLHTLSRYWIHAAALRLGCASVDGAAMAADDVGELERVLVDLKRQLPEGHTLVAVIADEELDF